MPVECQLRRVEEEHLADLRPQGIETQRSRRRHLSGFRDGQLELDAVDVLDEGDEILELIV